MVEATQISKEYGDLKVLQHIDLMVDRGSKIAFVGQNGQGKSTLAKIIVGDLEAKGDSSWDTMFRLDILLKIKRNI